MLFNEKFDLVNTDDDLELLCEKYPQYDRTYLCQASYGLRSKIKNWIESIWLQYAPYADSHFIEEFKRYFTQRSWELYLGATLLNRGYRLAKHSDEGPDFDVVDSDGNRVCWIEAIATQKGESLDKVPETQYGIVSSVPTSEMVLRVSSGLSTKHKKYLKYLEKGTVSSDDPFVIAIDRSQLEHVDAQLPLILKAVFGVGNIALRMRVGGKPVENPESFWTHEPSIKKQNGEDISTCFFDNPDHVGISAVIYSKDSILNSPRNSGEMGENFFIVHNPFASNPLKYGAFNFGEEWAVQDGQVKKIRLAKTFIKPDPFEHLYD